jgi:phosphate starvation-inducible PhoH-like protein
MIQCDKYICSRWAQTNLHKGDHIVTKRAKRTKAFKTEEKSNKVIDFKAFKSRSKEIQLLPKNITQEDYIAMLVDQSIDIVLATGPAGTGKTMLAVLTAIKALKEGKCEKIIITRPAVSVDEQHGFLPGSLIEKMAPWVRPIVDVLEEYYSPKEINTMMEEGIIEVSPLAYMRGRNFKNAYIIFDEAQNATASQMKMALTRISENSKMLITGDLQQSDDMERNGFKDFINRFENAHSSRIGLVRFTNSDVQRHPVVKEVLSIYKEQ